MKILLALAAAALSLPVAADNYNGRVAFKQTAPKVVQDSVRFGVDVVLDDVAFRKPHLAHAHSQSSFLKMESKLTIFLQ